MAVNGLPGYRVARLNPATLVIVIHGTAIRIAGTVTWQPGNPI
jgi:hypothetical protein